MDPSSKRVEVTLKSSIDSSKSKIDLKELQVGGVVSGKIRRVEPYGLFITIDNSNLVSLLRQYNSDSCYAVNQLFIIRFSSLYIIL